jgi:pantoate--beta-alanine ligase
VIGCPTIREADGLAMSSRNRLLSPEGREKAVALPRALVQTAEAISRGANPQDSIEAAIGLLETSGFASVEYLELRGADDLAPITTLDRPARLLAAAKMDDVRLIDNVPVLPGT